VVLKRPLGHDAYRREKTKAAGASPPPSKICTGLGKPRTLGLRAYGPVCFSIAADRIPYRRFAHVV
jgi:hypothetical protein